MGTANKSHLERVYVDIVELSKLSHKLAVQIVPVRA